jgi:hypothetical protein
MGLGEKRWWYETFINLLKLGVDAITGVLADTAARKMDWSSYSR